MSRIHFVPAFAALCAVVAHAQAPAPIERIKLTDGELGCQQMFDETKAMDAAIAEAKQVQSSGQATQTAGQAAGVAAEVASRTGLFGVIGGLGGHLFGSVASKAAAGVAEQSGQQTAAQAAERERQALARKEHLTSLFLAKGCSASNPAAAPANPNATVPLPASSAAPSTEQVLKALGGEFAPLALPPYRNDLSGEMRDMKRVVVPQFRVAFVAKTGVRARAGAGLANIGQSTGFNRTITQAQSVRIDMMIGNVDIALMQGIADRLYADFLKRLADAGKEVVPLAEIKASPGYTKLQFVAADKPYSVAPSADAREYVVVAPKDLPIAFIHAETQLGNVGLFDQENAKAYFELAATRNALVLVPTVIIDFAQLESSGNSNWATSAEASVTPKVGATGETTMMAITGKDAKLFFTGDLRYVRLDKPFYSDGEIGSVKQVDSFDNVGLANSLTALTGTQGTQMRYEKRLLTADPLRYSGKALATGATVNLAFVDALAAK